MLRLWSRSVLVVLLALCALSAVAPAQSTAPAAAPQTLLEQLVQLNDPDPTVRDAARRHILSLRVSDLPRLLQAVESLPEAAAGSAVTRLVLRDAIEHIYIREAKINLLQERRPTRTLAKPFMGIAPAGAQRWGEPARSGIPLGEIWAGFIAYEVFEEGDVLVGIRTIDGLERLRNFEDLTAILIDVSPGDPVEFFVMRGGRIVRASLRLEERLSELVEMDEDWSRARPEARRAAVTYWEEQLVPRLKRRQLPSPSAAA